MPAIAAATQRMIVAWESGPDTVDITAEMLGLTGHVAAEALFSTDIGGAGSHLGRALGDILAHNWRRMRSMFDLPQRLPSASRTAFHRGLADIDAMVAGITKTRGADRAPRDDLFARLVRARCAGGGMSPGERHRAGDGAVVDVRLPDGGRGHGLLR